jgi:hypothetical protein
MERQKLPVAAPKLWNSLPAEITSSRTSNTFKSALKALLFEKHYASP